MIKYILLITGLATLLFELSCNSNPVAPDQPGKRNYIWVADTLPYGYPFTSMWGSSPEDVWAVRIEGTTPYDAIWHYDGKKWAPYSQVVPSEAISIFGFSKNNVWLGGNNGVIWHFDGNNWSKAYTYKKEGQWTNEIDDIWGDSPFNLYAMGNYSDENNNIRGFILHYDGSNWKEEYFAPFNVNFIKIRCENGEVFLIGIKQYNTAADTTILYQYVRPGLRVGNSLHQIISKPIDQILNMNNIGNDIYVLVNTNLSRYPFYSLNKSISFPENLSIFDAYGRNDKDIFLSMTDGIAHYNGEDVKYLYTFPSYQLFIRSAIFENDVFFVVSDEKNGKYIMLHGMLNDSTEVKAR